MCFFGTEWLWDQVGQKLTPTLSCSKRDLFNVVVLQVRSESAVVGSLSGSYCDKHVQFWCRSHLELTVPGWLHSFVSSITLASYFLSH